MQAKPLTLIIDSVRSCYNVGSMLRTADAVGARVIVTGLTPYPRIPDDNRPGYQVERLTREIAKTALGAERTVPVLTFTNLDEAIILLKTEGYYVYALESQREATVNLFQAAITSPAALIVGSETDGLEQAQCDACDAILEIPMDGHKQSLNVSVAAGIGLYFFKNNRTTN